LVLRISRSEKCATSRDQAPIERAPELATCALWGRNHHRSVNKNCRKSKYIWTPSVHHNMVYSG